MDRVMRRALFALFLALFPLVWSSGLSEPPSAEAASNLQHASATFPGTCVSPVTAWAPVAALPIGVYGAAVDSDGRYVYSAGGYSASAGASVNQFVRFDPTTNAWSGLTPMPSPADEALGVYAEGRLYVFGGKNGATTILTSTMIYDIASDTWSAGAPLPAPRQQMAGAYWDGKIYIAGGLSTNNVPDVQDQMWEYDIAANTFTPRANLPVKLGGATGKAVNGQFYVFGGRSASILALDTVYAFDVAGHTWSTKSSMPAPVNVPGSALYFGKIWVSGGGNPFVADGPAGAGRSLNPAGPAAPNTSNVTQVYDPANDSWTLGPAESLARSFVGMATAGGVAVSVGGYDEITSSADTEVPVEVPLRVLIAYADAHVPPATLRSQLLALPGVGKVDSADVQTATLSLADLQPYDVVVAYDNATYSDSVKMGDVLADYQDGGGVVVGMGFDWYTAPFNLQGRWMSGGYSPFNSPATSDFISATLGTYDSNAPAMLGARTLSAFYRLAVTVAPGATQVAAWSDGKPAVAVKGHAVGINGYTGDYADHWFGDYARIIADAGFTMRPAQDECATLDLPLIMR